MKAPKLLYIDLLAILKGGGFFITTLIKDTEIWICWYKVLERSMD